MAHDHDDERAHHYDTGRIEAFSDGVFAIAITLLVLEIAVPHAKEGESLAEALRLLWPSYFAYALSFATIGIIWMNHHAMFRDIERHDHILLLLNLGLLLCIAFVPFPTAVLAAYMRNGSDAFAATFAYGITFTVTAVFATAMWLWASWDCRLIDEHVSRSRVRQRTRRYLPGVPLYAVGLVLALFNTWLAIGWWVALALFYVVPPEE